ncbi:MAG: cytochrome c maturation protein CcmE [Salinisphaeraceae bacterium]|jgi:cytochrome c-type biogenesis protein CcmE|nr:cytochrome c maturation protein CcmE [Salinisphaeraceae bacterium]
MTPKRKRRLLLVLSLVAGLGVAAALGLTAFRENLLYFYEPSAVVAGDVGPGTRFRIGGLVEQGSVERDNEALTVTFRLADCAASVPVSYRGILPDLFREGQGIVAYGTLDGAGLFVADEVLAKHDENYMPPEVADALAQDNGETCMPANMTQS